MPEPANPIAKYIENVLIRADLAPEDEQIVSAELNEHLSSLFPAPAAENPKEVYAMIEREFGKAGFVGKSISRAKGRLRTYFKKQTRKLPLRVAVALILGLAVRYAVAEPFYAASDVVAPQVPQGSRVLVYKLSRSFATGDVIVYLNSDRENRLGIVTDVQTSGLIVQRHGWPNVIVPVDHVIGRVILSTR